MRNKIIEKRNKSCQQIENKESLFPLIGSGWCGGGIKWIVLATASAEVSNFERRVRAVKSEPAPHNQPNQSRHPAILISGGHQRQLNISYERAPTSGCGGGDTPSSEEKISAALFHRASQPPSQRAGNLGQLQNGFKNGRRWRKRRTAIVPKKQSCGGSSCVPEY
jgi:hypothetical protein